MNGCRLNIYNPPITSQRVMKLSIRILIILVTLDSSCKEEEDYVCSVKNPIEDLPWLADDIKILNQGSFSQYFYVSWAIYESNTVFIYGDCCPNCNTITPVYDCSGNNIGVIGDGDEDIPLSIRDNEIIIWRADNFACSI